MKRTCHNCGKELILKRKNAYNEKTIKWCSLQCSQEWWRKNKKDLTKDKPLYKIRFNVFKRDNFKCFYCGKSPIEDNIKIELDHINPINQSRNRIEDWSIINEKDFVTSCSFCNKGKSNSLLTVEEITRIKEEIKKRI